MRRPSKLAKLAVDCRQWGLSTVTCAMDRSIQSLKRLALGRRVFISHAREDSKIAERIALAIRGRDCTVFLDEQDLPPGGNYEARIYQAIKSSSVFVFLISPASVSEGRYPLTELKFAEQKWPHPADRVLPVLVADMPIDHVPEYLRAASIMKARGDLAAEVAAAVDAMLPKTARLAGALAATVAIAIAGASAFYLRPHHPAAQVEESRQAGTTVPAEAEPPAPTPAGPTLASVITLPKTLDLKFSFNPQDPDNPNFIKNQVYLSVNSPPDNVDGRPLLLWPSDNLYHHERMEMPGPKGKFVAFVTRLQADSRLTNAPPAATAICLSRADPLPDVPMKNHAVLTCEEGKPCIEFGPTDAGWLRPANCGAKAGPAGALRPPRYASLFAAPAAAAPASAVWTVPSLNSLKMLREQHALKDGYTVFTISAAADTKIDADAYGLDLRVNDKSVLIEGLPADLRRRRVLTDQPLQIKFALQNLDFNGRYAGCDRIEANLLLYRDDESVGPPIALPFHYAALRDVNPTEIATAQGKFTWSATYEVAQAPAQNDWRVFLTSGRRDEVGHLDKMREDIGRLGLVFKDGGQDNPVVAIVRPPLKGTFGLALGIVQPSGQIKFTFSRDMANRLLTFAKDARSKNPAARNLIADSVFLYQEPPNIDRHYACAPAR